MTNPLSLLPDLVPSAAILVVLVLTSLKVRRAKKSQDRLVQSLVREECINWFRVKASRPAFFKRRLKLVGAESSAVLVNTESHVRVIADLPKGERLDVSYPKSGLQLEWLGNSGLGSANMHWIAIGQGENRLMLTADTGFNAVQSREATADICRKVNPAFQLPPIAQSDFALEKNKTSLAVMLACAALGAYALLDGIFVNHNELLAFGRIAAFGPALFVFALPIYFLLVRGKVPSRESLTLSILSVLALMLASIPALKRLDHWLASGSQLYPYTMTSTGRFTSVMPGPPRLTFDSTRDYWAQFDEGSVHQFELIHGPLGLWQLDHSNLDRKFRQFYEAKN